MEKVLILRTCPEDMTSWGGFVWPNKGYVEAHDWDPKPKCGKGLHGLLWGEGEGTLLNWFPFAKWLVVEVKVSQLVYLGGKVKFPCGHVIYCGKQKEATDYIRYHGGTERAIVGAYHITGDEGFSVVGYRGTAVSGQRGRSKVGDYGVGVSGFQGRVDAGSYSMIMVDVLGIVSAGQCCRITIGGAGSVVKAGPNSIISVLDSNLLTTPTVFMVGQNGIKPDVPYLVDYKGNLQETIMPQE